MSDLHLEKDLQDFANMLADAAGTVIREHFRTPFDIISKADESPVTVADRGAEAAMRALIEEHYPGHGIYGEEYGIRNPDARHVWVLDPIDGTRAFVTGLPIFGTLIALADEGNPVLGVLDQPIMKERWLGAVGQGAFLNGTPVKTRPCSALDQAALYMTSPDQLTTPAQTAAFQGLYESVRERRYGGDCYSTGLLASGLIDLHVEIGLQPYDYMALAPIIEAAGGVATTWDGKPLHMTSGTSFLGASSREVNEAARDLLAPGLSG